MGKTIEVEYNGERIALRDLAARVGINRNTLRLRIRCYGYSVERAVSEPVRKASRGGRPAKDVPRAAPKCKRHPSGRAYSRWKAGGRTFERYFGKHGSAEAAEAYRRFAIDWANGRYVASAPDAGAAGGRVSVATIAGRWFEHCQGYYVKDGKTTTEVGMCRTVARTVKDSHGAGAAEEFTPAKLREYRDTLIARGLVRNTVNAYVGRVIRMFAWGAAQSLVPAAVHGALALVEPLKAGRTAAPDRAKKRPASDGQIAATITQIEVDAPASAAKYVAMIRLQRLAGMRPCEVCALSAADLDTSADVWRYEVGRANKNLHRGKAQVYYFGPKAVEILRPFLAVAPSGPLFGISRGVYGDAVRRASERAGCGRWTPHQLRHALATEVAERFRSLEHAAAAIGDSETVASAVYIHVDPRERAKIEVARAMG